MSMKIRCVVAGTNASGQPDFFGADVEYGHQAEYAEGCHYAMAKEMAEDAGFAEPMVAFDEKDGPAWLFERVFAAKADALDGG